MKKKIFYLAIIALAIFILIDCNVTDASDQTSDAYLTLVNKTHPVPSDWENQVAIDTVFNSLGEELKIEHKTYDQFLYLRDELLNEGIQIELDSVYRSVAEQQEIWDEWMVEYGEEYVKNYLAVPGYSEHHTGLAVDIFVIDSGKIIRDNDDMIASVEIFAKIHELLPKYGFILRYLEGKEEITGYSYEPWHLRFVNSKDIAEEITMKGLTLEEYLDET